MQRVNQYRFYEVATAIHPLTEFRADQTKGEAWGTLFTAANWITFLLGNQLTPLETCRSSLIKLSAAVSGALPDATLQGDALIAELAVKINQFLTWNIQSAAKDFEVVFAAELETLATYFVSKKGIYSTGDLIDRADQHFAPEIHAMLSDDQLRDLRQAGKCLAFDLDTASGFHMLRATESAIHQYYVAVTKTTPKRKDRNWGAYVRNLNAFKKKNPQAGVDAKLISLIDQVREHHRNPVIHPEDTLTAAEALTLFSVCQGMIISFCGALAQLNAAGATQLALVASKP